MICEWYDTISCAEQVSHVFSGLSRDRDDNIIIHNIIINHCRAPFGISFFVTDVRSKLLALDHAANALAGAPHQRMYTLIPEQKLTYYNNNLLQYRTHAARGYRFGQTVGITTTIRFWCVPYYYYHHHYHYYYCHVYDCTHFWSRPNFGFIFPLPLNAFYRSHKSAWFTVLLKLTIYTELYK